MAFMKKVQNSMTKFREILEDFIQMRCLSTSLVVFCIFSANLLVGNTFVMHKYFLIHAIKILDYLKFLLALKYVIF